MVTRITVGAHYGLKDWLAQRITAVVMAGYLFILVVALVAQKDLSQEAWRALLSGGFMRFLTFIFILSLAYHAWVGVRDIWMDYVQPVGWRLSLHVLTALYLVGCAGWAVQILWSL
jgi:succinate dehydrogenase / fumarate reductase membrane anchor subunit